MNPPPPYHDNTNINGNAYRNDNINQPRIDIINDEESFNEETPLINEKILEHYEANMHRKRGRLSTCSKIILLIIFTIFIFILGNIIYFTFAINNQIHLSFSDTNTSDVTITWITLTNSPLESIYIELFNGNQSFMPIVEPSIDTFSFLFLFNRYIYSSKVNVGNNKSISYKIIDDNINWKSKSYNYKSNINKDSQNVLIYGDMGYSNNRILNNVHDEVKQNDIDFILHIGDFAYNFEDYFGTTSDLFFSNIEKIASETPYMAIPGNHENFNNFSFYKHVFNMPLKPQFDNLFYNLDKPPIKFININTEAYYFESLKPTIETQTNFIESQLKDINRTKYPWLIVTGHRPMYCSSDDNDYCTRWQTDPLRLALEDTFFIRNITLYISGHEHNYERICPIFNGQCQENMSTLKTYYKVNGLYPIHIITGAAGNKEKLSDFLESPEQFSLFRKCDYGYGLLYANYTHLIWTQKGTHGNVIDRFVITN